MAGQITHILAGEEALRRAAPGEAEALLEASGTWFRLGCQGPDIFYHNQRTRPSALHLGGLAHRRGYGALVEAALAFVARPGAPRRDFLAPAASCLLGMATHAAVDRATHPFIVCFAGWREPGSAGAVPVNAHAFLERLLDAAYLEAVKGLRPSDLDLEALTRPRGPDTAEGMAELLGLWAAGLRAAYPRAAGEDALLERRVENAMADALRFFALTNPAATREAEEAEREWFLRLGEEEGRKAVALLYPEPPAGDLDPMNLARAAWPHPSGDGRESSASYPDLVEEGIEGGAASVRALLGALASGPPFVGVARAVGDGSLSVADEGGKAAPPRVSRPLPLGPLMEAEYRRRAEIARGAASN